MRNIPSFNGWDNQLNNEPGIQIIAERRNRVWKIATTQAQFDAITRHDGSLSNVATYLNFGLELRIGSHLPNEFGTSPIRSAVDELHDDLKNMKHSA